MKAPPDRPSPEAERLRDRIRELVGDYYAAAHPESAFVPGVSEVPCAGRVVGAEEMRHLVDAGLDCWLTTGRFAEVFERELARSFGVREAVLVNSGSSANLLAVTCLTSPMLGERRLERGDEVITVATGFPTTAAPIVQNGLVPVFVDVAMPTYNVDVSALEAALSPRTRALIFAHTLGNPFDLATVSAFARQHSLWLIEDCCDALGARYDGRHVGTVGDLATASFYPAHHITMGEGGAVLTDNPLLRRIVESFRDWGRDCWCAPGHDNTCGKRFDWQLGDLPFGYDHKYIYSHLGYNLKATDMQAAAGVAQLQKLSGFVARRRANFDRLQAGLADLGEHFVLPEATPRSEPSWFGFPLSVRPETGLARRDLVQFLTARRIGSRQIFAGNLVRQPAFLNARIRAVGTLANADYVMAQSFWVGVYPGLSDAALDYIIESLHVAVAELPRNTRP
jgi:CDP-4-dehydro-6-deoxyglucose reductase, E1